MKNRMLKERESQQFGIIASSAISISAADRSVAS